MKIKKICIENFKSIKKIDFPLKSYGKGKSLSNTALLIGINESGKSSILKGISLLSEGIKEIEYLDDCFIDAQEDDKYIDIYGYLDFTAYEENIFIESFIEKTGWDKTDFSNLNCSEIVKNVYSNSSSSHTHYYVYINDNFPHYKYIKYDKKVNKNGRVTKTEHYGKLSKVNGITEEITESNYQQFLKTDQKIITKEELESQIAKKIYYTLDAYFAKIILWKPIKKFLISETINLNEFKKKPDSNIPLSNIFKICGAESDEEIENGLKNQRKTDELKEKLETAVTKHVNTIWKEHKIKFIISINGSNCEVHVEDKDKKFNRFTMAQRSDGFKQFVSLMLSLSALNKTNELEDYLILIDEPEIHLHPSGIKYLRDELLKIGKKNDLIISTHSSFLVDTEVPERHWIVTKSKAETGIMNIDESTPLSDENVLKAAFGLSIFKELLPNKILVVEGEDDKSIIQRATNILNKPILDTIKTAKGASKALTLASLLDDQNISAHFLFDDDKEGRTFKAKIEKGFNKFFENKVYTLRDLVGTIPENSTMEDLLPREFVVKTLKRELNQNFNIRDNIPILKQAKDQNKLLRQDKEKLESVKRKISEGFFLEYKTKTKLRNNCMDLIKLIEKLEEKLS